MIPQASTHLMSLKQYKCCGYTLYFYETYQKEMSCKPIALISTLSFFFSFITFTDKKYINGEKHSIVYIMNQI